MGECREKRKGPGREEQCKDYQSSTGPTLPRFMVTPFIVLKADSGGGSSRAARETRQPHVVSPARKKDENDPP